jgi:hypothetical protein
MRVRRSAALLAALLAAAVFGSACGGVLEKEYEYEEELYLDLDGSATVYVNASVPALVALRGVDLPVDPRARIDRGDVRALFEGPGAAVRTPTLSRRDGRRFVHVRIDVGDLAALGRIAPLSWSSYRLTRNGTGVEFRQVVGAAAEKAVGDVGWTGAELVAFRMHLPSRIEFHNATSGTVQRGNILSWEQPLADRLRGAPLDLQARMEGESILYRTLLLFAGTGVAALGTLALLVWWMARPSPSSRGRPASQRPS